MRVSCLRVYFVPPSQTYEPTTSNILEVIEIGREEEDGDDEDEDAEAQVLAG